MKYGAILMVVLGISAVQCLPSEVKGRQEAVTENEVAELVSAVLPDVEVAADTAVTIAADLDVNVNKQVKYPGEHGGHVSHKPYKKPHHPQYYAPLIQLNLLSAVGHIVSPLLKGVLEPLFTNVVYGIVGAVIKTLQHPEIDFNEHPTHSAHDTFPTKFPEYKSAPDSAIGALFDGFDAYVMRVPGAGKYLFISSDRNLGSAGTGGEADKNLTVDDYEEIPFSANPLLNSIFGTIRVRSGPIPDKKVESYVKQQLGGVPNSETD